ncbi:vesicle-associated protein 3-1-like [Ipomoea triloba]|uniref:vesicle-associated protein 3-1-like n=1 Tax=Ipomoea triloba TaxID=35885 RepID=UPI00125E7B93|nr:vesicle-associated protein 3-1-like [Ipomoea triloba]
MSTAQILTIEPLELRFPFELKKQISCSLQLSNRSDNHVAFKVKTTNPKKYCVRPNIGIVLPRSTCDVIVTMQAQKEMPPNLQCKDKFLVQSVVATPGATPKDITGEMFNKEAGSGVEECKLKVTYVPPPQPPSPVAEESEADLLTENCNTNGSEVTRSFNDTHDSSSEARPLTSNLTEEKAPAVQQSDAPRQQLELTKHDANKRGFGSASIMFIIGVALLSVVVGYFLKSS